MVNELWPRRNDLDMKADLGALAGLKENRHLRHRLNPSGQISAAVDNKVLERRRVKLATVASDVMGGQCYLALLTHADRLLVWNYFGLASGFA